MSRTDAGLLEGTQRTSGLNSRKGGRSGKGSSNSSHSDDHSSKRKSSQQTRYSNNGGGRSNNGGRDSTHSHKSADGRYKTTTEYTDSKQHGKGGASSKDGSHHGWHKTHRSNEGQRGSKGGGGHSKNHSVKSTKVVPPLEGQDSGISVGENISPEGKRAHETNKEATVKEDTVVRNDDSSIPDNDGNKDGDVLTVDVMKKEKPSAVIVYDRKLLLELKNSITSLVTPLGFDQLPPEIAKDILKTSRRYSESESKDDVSEARNEDIVKHNANSLLLNRDQNGTDQKGSVKVSLMPQRRSFGSGCSWRDHPSSKPSPSVPTTDNESSSSNTNPASTTSSGGTGWTTVTSSSSGHHSHPPRVIDHVPYRSRPNQEWKGTSNSKGYNNWRGNKDTNTTELNEEEEPEWMSFSPSDEMMELKGIDEHELEREARKTDKVKLNEEERLSSLVEESPSSSPVDKPGGTDLVDSGLPSSCPNDDDEDGFILDGFDFKNVLSICRELDSDDGDTPSYADHVDKDSLCKAKDTNELKNALISVLGITKEMAAAGPGRGNTHNQTGMKQQPNQGRPLTLDEIEGHIPIVAAGTQDNADQTAFNRFLESMTTSTTATTPSKSAKEDTYQHPQNTNKTEFSGPSGLTKPLKQNPLLSDDSQSVHIHTPSSPTIYQPYPSSQSNKQPHPLPSPSITDEWPLTSTSSLWSDAMPKPAVTPLLNPSPSSLGMHPHHKYHSNTHSSTGMIPPLMSSGSSNTNWATEMEQIRISELNQMKHPLTSSSVRDERAMKMHQQQQHHLTQQKGGGYVPSLSFLPTSVMRHMHNSKPSQPMKDKDMRGKIPTNKRLDQEYSSSQSTEHTYSPRSTIPPEGMYPGSAFQYPSPPPPPHFHYPPMATPHPPLQYPYRSSMRPMGTGDGYHIPSPHRHPMPGSHYVGMGSMKPAGNY